MKICVLLVLIGAGTLLTSLCISVIAISQGVDMDLLREMMTTGEGDFPKSMMTGMLWAQSIAGFILPGFLFGWMFYKKSWLQYFRLRKFPAFTAIAIAVVTLFASYPLVQLSFEINGMLPLPGWMTEMEDNAAKIMQDILAMDSTGSFLLTLLLVAILPGIGEELIFRGILQQQVREWTGRPVLSVWIAAFIFSAIHMQFEGFLPRIALGAVLGFLYLWSNNLWIPMLVHAINNGAQVAVLYFAGIDLSNVEEETSMPVNAWIIILSVVALYLCYYGMKKFKTTDG